MSAYDGCTVQKLLRVPIIFVSNRQIFGENCHTRRTNSKKKLNKVIYEHIENFV